MIIDALLGIVTTFLGFVLSLIPSLPPFPSELQNVLNQFIDILHNSIGLLFVFVRPSTLRTLLPLVVALINFDYIYKFVMFILKKIPFLGIE